MRARSARSVSPLVSLFMKYAHFYSIWLILVLFSPVGRPQSISNTSGIRILLLSYSNKHKTNAARMH